MKSDTLYGEKRNFIRITFSENATFSGAAIFPCWRAMRQAMRTVTCVLCCVVVWGLTLCSGDGEVCEDEEPWTRCRIWSTTLDMCGSSSVSSKCARTCHACGPCKQNPCTEGKVCESNSTSESGSYQCVCADGYRDGPCSDSVCVGVSSCQNGGTCMVDAASASGYTCVCITGFTGSHCQECSDDLSTCSTWAEEGYCTSNAVFTGNYCRLSCAQSCPICIRQPCLNGGTCLDDGSCNCSGTGFTGKNCEVNELCVPNPCQHGGTCTSDGTCTCTGTGFVGQHCEVNEECVPDPCHNGGTCTHNATCNCAGTGFMGQYCEEQTCPQLTRVSQYQYQEVPVLGLSSRSSLVFSVRACSDAHLALSASLDLSSQMVEVVLGAGGNTFSTIRKCKLSCVLVQELATLLSCESFRAFWLSWATSPTSTSASASDSSTTLSLGVGEEVGTGTRLAADLGSVLEVNHVSIAGYHGAEGTWNFDFKGQTTPTPCPTTTPEMTTQTTETDLTTSSDAITTPPPPPPNTVTSSEPEASTSSPPSPQTSSESSPTAEPSTAITKASQTSATTTITTTTPPTAPTVTAAKKCTCRKRDTSPSKEDLDKAEELAVRLKKNLTLTNQTSAQKRTKISALDHRPSAQALGSLGIGILVVVAMFVIAPDVLSVCGWLKKTAKEKRKSSKVNKANPGLLVADDVGEEADDDPHQPHPGGQHDRFHLHSDVLNGPGAQTNAFLTTPDLRQLASRSSRRPPELCSRAEDHLPGSLSVSLVDWITGPDEKQSQRSPQPVRKAQCTSGL